MTQDAPSGGRGRIVTIGSLFAVALLALGFLVGFVVDKGTDAPSSDALTAVPAADSVDVGFLQDMITHHNQAIVMAHNAEIHSTDPEIQRMAYDLLTTQQGQIGTMRGWLMLWQQPEQTYRQRMSWMGTSVPGHDMGGMDMGGTTSARSGDSSAPGSSGAQDGAVMPGMATNAELAKLATLRGEQSDVYYLQLMIRHHQGGTAMMEYAATHAGNPVLRNFAGQMANTQAAEVSVMTQMLAQRGAAPLAAP